MHSEQNGVVGILRNLFMGVSTAKIIDFLMSYKDFDYSEADIARYSSVSPRQIYRAIPILEAAGLVNRTRISGRSKMYRLTTNSVATHYLEKFTHALGEVKEMKVQSTLEVNPNEKLPTPQQ